MSDTVRVPGHHRPERRRATPPESGHADRAAHAPPPVQAPVSGRLSFAYVVRQLVADKWLSRSDSERVLAISDRERVGHPIAVLAEMNFRTPDAQRRLLDLEVLTQWLAEKVKLPYQHIDPLRVDFTHVVEVMSSAYATGHSILPIAVKSTEIVVATC
jgi:general secretion pathway protein E